MLPINLDGPNNVLAGPSEAYEWAHPSSKQFFQLFQMGPVPILQDLPKHMHGPSCVLIDAANNLDGPSIFLTEPSEMYMWAQLYFNRCCQ